MSRPLHHHAIVIGASTSGLCAARVLAEHFEVVTVLDRDTLPEGIESRKGVPQGRHAHALLAGGAQAIERLFPGIEADMTAAGATLLDFDDGRWHQAGGYRTTSLLERRVIGASRPLIEGVMRRRVGRLSNVRIEQGVAVEGLRCEGSRIVGARLFDGTSSTVVEADLVVDCSGRASQSTLWLEELGFEAPEVAEVRCDMRYGTRILRRRPTDLDGTFAVIIESPPDGKRAGFLMPIEDDRWIVTIAAGFGAQAPTDEASLLAIAASLPSPEIHDVLLRAEPLGPVATHRLVSSKRRRYEKLAQVPAGFLALGDSICSFNPVYGQGMSSGSLQAAELNECLQSLDNDAAMVRAFYKRAAKVIANPWQITVGNDFSYPECTGRKPVGTDQINRYMRRALLAAQVSPEVNTALLLVQNLLAAPATLFRPSIIRAVRRGAREAERRNAHGTVGRRRPVALGA